MQGICAEKCVSDFGFTRQQQDDFAILSYKRAAEAWKVSALMHRAARCTCSCL